MDFIELLGISIGTASIVSAVISSIAAFIGKIWLNQIFEKQKSEQEAKIRKIQANLDKDIHVYRLQFEKEFHIYEEIWKSLVELQSATLSLRPPLDYQDPNQPEEDRKKERLYRFSNAIVAFTDVFLGYQPFYPTDIFNSLNKIMHMTQIEAMIYKDIHKKAENINTYEYWKEVEKAQGEIIDEINTCLHLIRARIEYLNVSS